MGQTLPPLRQLNLGGVFTSGHPLRRPTDTALRCLNLRPLPGGGMRLRGGWVRIAAAAAGREYVQFYEFIKGSLSAGVKHLAQTTEAGGEKWQSITDLATGAMTSLETINGPVGTAARAITTVRDRVFFANGYGVRDVTNSRPAFSSWDGTTVRYAGLDAYCPSGLNPTAALTVGAGNNHVLTSLTIYVGLYNATTNHFSNGVLAGKVLSGNGTINVSNLNRLSTASHNATETAELYYVFYSTPDGYSVPYLILNAAGTDVYRVAASSTTASLSLTSADDKGFFLDVTREMPRANFPPRPMSEICYANGRVYGVLDAGGSGAAATFGGFSYLVQDRDAAAIVWSASSDDIASQETAFVGVPEESFPLTNKKFVPNGQRPLKLADLSNRLLVITKSGTFYLEETADGLHVFEDIDNKRGILDKRTFVQTSRGPMWVTQFREIVRLDTATMRLEVLSHDYSELLGPSYWSGATFGVAATYILDPKNQLDEYQVWASNGYSITHDFALEADQARRGQTVAPAYTANVFPLNCAASLTDANGLQYHLVGKDALWAQEVDPSNNQIPTRDQAANGTYAEIEGDWIGQWLDYGDPDQRKEVGEFQLTGDAAYSLSLNRSPIRLSFYTDLTDQDYVTDLEKKPTSAPTDLAYRGQVGQHVNWIKWRLQISGHSQDSIIVVYPSNQSFFGEFDLSIITYATVVDMGAIVRLGNNR